jgi:hypothetical protein
MKVKLVRHHLKDDPTWDVIEESVPLGTQYEVIGYESKGFILANGNRMCEVECFLVMGNGSSGWLPTCLFEAVEDDGNNANRGDTTN